MYTNENDPFFTNIAFLKVSYAHDHVLKMFFDFSGEFTLYNLDIISEVIVFLIIVTIYIKAACMILCLYFPYLYCLI